MEYDINHIKNDAVHTLFKMCDEAIYELIQLTDVEHPHDINIESVALRLFDDMRDNGYIIYELCTDDVFKKSFILQFNGIQIARRDVCLNITIR